MALPHLIKFVYNNGTDEVIRRGKKIHAISYVELMEHDDLLGSVTFRVKDDSYATYYKVYVQKYKDPRGLSVRCTCPYNLGDICRHETAALLQLQDLLDKNVLGEKDVLYHQRHTVIKMKDIELKSIRLLSSPDSYAEAEKILHAKKVNIVSAENERVEASLVCNGETFPLVIQKNEERNFDTSCKCDEQGHPLCVHKVALFLQLLNAYGPYYFDSIRNWDKQKNKLLEIYGYSLEDDLTGKFEFTYKDGKPFLRVLDTSIKRAEPVSGSMLNSRPVVAEKEIVVAEEEAPLVYNGNTSRIGIVFNGTNGVYPNFGVDAVSGEINETGTAFAGKVEKLDLSKFVSTDNYPEHDKQLLQQIRKLNETEVNKYVSRNSPFSGIWENIIHHEDDDLPEETKSLIAEYWYPKLLKLFNEQKDNALVYFLPQGKNFVTSSLLPVQLSDETAIPVIYVNTVKTKIEIACYVQVNGVEVPLQENEWNSYMLFKYADTFYNWSRQEDILEIERFANKENLLISKEDWPDYLKKNIIPLTKEYKVRFAEKLVQEVKDGNPEVRVLLQEKGDYLLFVPVFSYKGFETRFNAKDIITLPVNDKVLEIHRNRQAELQFIKKLESLHSNFIHPEGAATLALKGADVLKNNWFFLFVDSMKEMNVPVAGFDVLKNFRFNTARPSTEIHISNGIDWFDAKVKVVFGEQQVSIDEIKRALINKQQFVQLNDGTLGILPENWLKKYSLLFRVGEGKNNALRLSKYHLSVIDELYEERDEAEVLIELEEKYNRLRGFNRIKEIDPPARLAHILRPYQVAGYHWLNYLSEVGWGGILADDMGLGKTVQALSFLQFYRDTRHSLKAIVVCPTTLMFNWENEIKKFTPDLTYHIHHGADRGRDKEGFNAYNILITTYGTLRSDIKLLTEIPFDYVILDESQAIKNPQSKVTKAAGLLVSKNRLCLSGTPLQNNTFDIYAQMNFLNPGMLGSVEYFRNEFATPIDKFGEQDRKDHLKKLLYPFILRRTKEQVAKDLPEKTETILFCEMQAEQREIYEAFRMDYRNKILGVINEQGIQKSQLTILQGLMKLRQICDSPAIMNEPEKYPNHSIKLEEIAREITENISNHKALVFSQFLGMLALIKEKLKSLEVPFEYFDGSTPAHERERAINRFQEDDTCRAFLISLKAGGVGLNLTAADYVYIVDPWWNPAVEQQAIDRTHRIGQTKNIFAYRMICKDTIEDKILQLQEKKRSLARDLIADDNTFVKSLSKEDVEYLFS
ncbi:DEAD/DEAH box helicase [Agriterribacter sp.]|uniref:DEAD/DEAH box helicase n=1 Tax=Agriterribacter sp. TaxID=2821509 RepID=UPI002BBFB7CE|nr:DEAD/DEAH box helicase [Agriterribacter sp.]HTN05170.1 DEAD/DEAH box helicase [Agriterribacter sp.]